MPYILHILFLWSIPLYLLIYNLSFVFIDSFKTGVSQGLLLKAFIIFLGYYFMKLWICYLGITHTQYLRPINSWHRLPELDYISMAHVRPKEGSESHKERLLPLPVTWNTTKWSDIMVHDIPCTCFESASKLLVNIWSISVAVSLVTLVGLVISGNILYEYMISKNPDVGLWFSCLRRSIFKSPRK